MYVTVGNMKERHFSPSSYSNIYALLLNPLYQLAIATCMSRRQQVGVFACFVSVFAKGLFPRTVRAQYPHRRSPSLPTLSLSEQQKEKAAIIR